MILECKISSVQRSLCCNQLRLWKRHFVCLAEIIDTRSYEVIVQ
eukprot:jgi/Antlo1/1353/525